MAPLGSTTAQASRCAPVGTRETARDEPSGDQGRFRHDRTPLAELALHVAKGLLHVLEVTFSDYRVIVTLGNGIPILGAVGQNLHVALSEVQQIRLDARVSPLVEELVHLVALTPLKRRLEQNTVRPNASA